MDHRGDLFYNFNQARTKEVMELMHVDLVVTSSGVKAAGNKIQIDVAYFIPGFWYRVSREGARLIAILVLNGGHSHEVCRLDITKYGKYRLAPYAHIVARRRGTVSVQPKEVTEEQPSAIALDEPKDDVDQQSSEAAPDQSDDLTDLPSEEQAEPDDTYAPIHAVIRLFEEIQKTPIRCMIKPLGSMMRNVRRAWPPHSRHITDGQWQRVGKKATADASMTSTDATFIIFVAERGNVIMQVTVWMSITCNIDELVEALEDL
jgi:hypothetical protein